MKILRAALNSALLKIARTCTRGALYGVFALFKALACFRPLIVPYLRRRALKQAHKASGPGNSGVSILIPEFRTPQLLAECLASVQVACRKLRDPCEIIVVVNGAPERDYVALRDRFHRVRWYFYQEALGFHGAVRAGLAVTTHGWVYLLNSDMVLDARALEELLPWRSPSVFAIASQIFFHDAQKRREETGWTQMVARGGMVEFWDVPPECPDSVRGTAYAGGGASLFQKHLLLELSGRRTAYPPAYWEDIEWGAVAWQKGYASLFCPRSKVTHRHRASYSQLYSEEQIAGILHVNQCRFHLRNPLPGRADWDFLRAVDDGRLAAALRGCSLGTALLHRFISLFYPWDATLLEHAPKAWFRISPTHAKSKPVVLLVSPYCLFPPAHGGAVRVARLLQELSQSYHFVLLTDEGEAYTQASRAYYSLLAAVHPVSGRRETSTAKWPRIARVRSHSHDKIGAWLEWLQAFWRADLVQVEWVECSALITRRMRLVPWVITLHDVLLSEHPAPATREDRFELQWIREYSAALTCCKEDASLLHVAQGRVVPNGMRWERNGYCPSSAQPVVLFMGPFRYEPNWLGIRTFLCSVYPAILRQIPDLELWILGGSNARQSVLGLDEFRHAGVKLIDYVEDTRDCLNRCSVTINPLYGVRGSCIKILESLSAERLCVSTRQGARGYGHLEIPQLITVESIEEFESPLVDWLTHPHKRWAVERLSPALREQLSWANSARLQARIYDELLGKGTEAGALSACASGGKGPIAGGSQLP